MIDIESKIISYREDTNDYRLCLTREEITEINQALTKREQIRTEAIDEIISKAHCEDADCFECPFGTAEKCLLGKW